MNMEYLHINVILIILIWETYIFFFLLLVIALSKASWSSNHLAEKEGDWPGKHCKK